MAPFFVPATARFSPPPPPDDLFLVYDCRHGRALLHGLVEDGLLVWDLVTGVKHHLPSPKQFLDRGDCYSSAAVLCAADHVHEGDCRSTPFKVVLMFTDEIDTTFCVYSSEAGVWGDFTTLLLPDSSVEDIDIRSVLLGNTIYWLLSGPLILECDLDRMSFDIIEVPWDGDNCYEGGITVIRAEDGGLGFAAVENLSLHLWSRKPDGEGGITWTLHRTIDLEKLLPAPVVTKINMTDDLSLRPVGFAEEADVIFIGADSSVYMVHVKSMQCTEVLMTGKKTVHKIYPYASFYAPGVSIGGGGPAILLSNG
uniref:F-box protein AT5G49610-like beta-propeller domain-containing protein n=1 Tax=Arundo donax TaxID=35708 RepID=A0A0A8ZGJ9_ARUDO